MMLLKDVHDIERLLEAISRCRDDVILRSADGREELNMKSRLSQYIAIERLHRECGDQYEFFCMNPADEGYMLEFFYDMAHEKRIETETAKVPEKGR